MAHGMGLRVMAAICGVLLAGCVVPDEGSGNATVSPAGGFDVEVKVRYANDCPPGSTCAPIGGGTDADLWLDGQLVGRTDDFGKAVLHGVTAGAHVLCAHRRDLGNDTRDIEVGAGASVEFLLHRHAPACP